MRAQVFLCALSALWLQTLTLASEDAALPPVASKTAASKVEKRSAAADVPAFGLNTFREQPMIDWNTIYNNKRPWMGKRQFLGRPDAALLSAGAGDQGMDSAKMVNWDRVFNKRQWALSDEPDLPFGADRSLSRGDLVNWGKLFTKRKGADGGSNSKRAFGGEKAGLGRTLDGLDRQEMQKWGSFDRFARAQGGQ